MVEVVKESIGKIIPKRRWIEVSLSKKEAHEFDKWFRDCLKNFLDKMNDAELNTFMDVNWPGGRSRNPNDAKNFSEVWTQTYDKLRQGAEEWAQANEELRYDKYGNKLDNWVVISIPTYHVRLDLEEFILDCFEYWIEDYMFKRFDEEVD